MLNYNQFNSMLNEGFIIKNNILYFDSSGGDFINTDFGKGKFKPYSSKIENGVIYSIYNKNKSIADKDMYTEVLKSIKGQSSLYKMDYDSYHKFIVRTSIYIADLIIKENIDIILVMDSSSPLISDLSIEINKRLPKYYDMFTFNKQIFKTPDIQDITINTSGIELSDTNYKSIESSLNKMKKDGTFKIHNIYAPNRKFIQNWLKINNNILSKIIDNNVALLDDIFTTGSTIKEAGRLLNDAGAKRVVGITIIKGK